MTTDGAWYRDSNYPMDWWQSDVASGRTEEGYGRWLRVRYEEDGKDPPVEVLAEIRDYQDDGLDSEGRADLPGKYRARYPREDWEREVEDLDTKLGYQAWLMHQASFDEEWEQEQEALAHASSLDEQTPQATTVRSRPRV